MDIKILVAKAPLKGEDMMDLRIIRVDEQKGVHDYVGSTYRPLDVVKKNEGALAELGIKVEYHE